MKNRIFHTLLCIAAGLCLCLPTRGDIPEYHFNNIIQTKYYGGLHSIAKDATGYVWACGHEAVIRYDGYDFTNFTATTRALAPNDYWNYDNVVTTPDGALFVGSNHGLLRFDAQSSTFHILHSGNVGSLCSRSDALWMVLDGVVVTTDTEGDAVSCSIVSEYDVDTPHLAVYACGGKVFAAWNNHITVLDDQQRVFHDFTSLPENASVKDVLFFEGRLYILTLMDGVFACGEDAMEMKHIVTGENLVGAKKLYRDSNGIIWVSSQRGLLLYNPVEGSYRVNSFEVNNPYSLPVSSVWDIYGDPDSGVWISTYGGRLAYSDLSLSDLAYYNDVLPYPIVSCFCQSVSGDMWVGTEGGGIAVLNTKSGKTVYITQNDGLASNYVKSIVFSDPEYMLVSTYNGSVQYVNVNTHKVKKALPDSGVLSVYSMCSDMEGGWWLTSPDEPVIHLAECGKLTKKSFTGEDATELRGIEEMFRKDNLLYFVSAKGLFAVDETQNRIVHHFLIDHGDYSTNNLSCHCVLRNGDVWLGTIGAGINVLKSDGAYGKLTIPGSDALSQTIVCGILQDSSSDDVWVCCEDSFYLYDSAEGCIGKEYNVRLKGAAIHGACYVDDQHRMYFASTDGFVAFTPSKILKNSQHPRVFFTKIRVNGREASPESLAELKHGNAHVELDLACNCYSGRRNITYAYRVQGLSDDWTELPQGQRTIQLMNPRAGSYTIEVKAANNSNVWSDEISALQVRIYPSPWLSWWAYCLYTLVLVGGIVFVTRFNMNKKLLEQQLASEHERADYIKATALARTRFFTNISHDLKTPLTLLEDPLKRMKENLPADSPVEKYVATIERNVNRISHMISQLLHFREIESQKVVLNNQEGDFVRFAKDIFYLFEPYASQKGIEMVFKSQSDSFVVAFDYDVIEKILSNLCSNAIKYTVTDGLVGMSISHDDNKIHISVVNTGTGIPDDKKELIFGEFAKLPGQHPNFQSSTGLGLAIVKELVNALDGRIELHSSDSRVEFSVSFPYQKASRAAYELNTEYDYASAEVDNLFCNYVPKTSSTPSSRKANSVLVVDDDPQMRSYLETNLSDKFNVYTAADGLDGIAKADKVNPQVIVSDLMMPEMDGYELCRKIRHDIRISHIPVVVMSGNVGKEAKLKAMEAGANVFMDKPVDVELLIHQIEGLIRTVEEMREKYSKRFIAEPASLSISSMDEKLLEKAMACIERNMDNFDYDVDTFVSDMAIGRTVLYRKINDITGMSIKEFIMDIRLKRALQLIRESDYNISEISMMTGFINPKYFSVCFRRHFDMSPSEYKKKLN